MGEQPADSDLSKDELKLYTTTQVAELCEVTTETVRNWLNEGHLKGIKINNEWRVKRGDLLDFLNRRYA